MKINKKRFIYSGIFVILTFSLIFVFIKLKNTAVSVEFTVTERGNITDYIEENSIVRLEMETEVYASSGGKVIAVMAGIGDSVNKGDTLVKLDEKDLTADLKRLELQKVAALTRRDEAKKDLSESELRRFEAEERSAKVALDEAKRLAEKNEILYDAGGISKSAYESAVAALRAAEANYDIVKHTVDLALQDITPERVELLDIEIKEIQTQIDLLLTKHKDLIIRAPVEGIITEKDVETGSIIQPGKKIFQIGDMAEVFLECDILMEDIKDVDIGSNVIIENKDLGLQGIKGTVRKVYPKAFNKISELGIEQKRIKTEIDFAEPVSKLRPGYDMNIKVITSISDNVLLIDEKAIFEYQGNNYVFLNDNGIARMVQIETGIESVEKVEIKKGLKEGDMVILSPEEKIKNGTKIK